MSIEWNQSRLQQYIDDETQEGLILDYKAAEALAKSDGKKSEITKDVAAMANSAGGTIIYGIKEYDEPDKKHLPERLDPIDLTQFSKEWLEQVINNIRPRISGISIYPVSINTVANGVAYVVEIPQSFTAHQSNDHRYYKRFNFMSVPMEDYEIRDVMSRNQHPKIELRFEVEITSYTTDKNTSYSPLGIIESRDKYGMRLPPEMVTYTTYTLKTRAFNVGSVYAKYINANITIPFDLLEPRVDRITGELSERELNLAETFSYREDNTVRDVIKGNPYGSPERAAARHVPLLPRTSQKWDDTRLSDNFEEIDWGVAKIEWVVYCDNAQPSIGEIAVKDIPINDRRNKKDDED